MSDTANGADLDQLSLTQALVDFEVANARVIDLTARLVEAHRMNAEANAELDALRAELAAKNRVLAPLRRSGVLWAVHKAKGVRRAIRN